jgi:hypothetical protein
VSRKWAGLGDKDAPNWLVLLLVIALVAIFVWAVVASFV